MPFDQYFRIVATLLAISCVSGLLLSRPLKSWPAARWIDHPNEELRWIYRVGLLLACLLPLMSVVWISWGVFIHFFHESFDPYSIAQAFQVSQFLVPILLAFVLYRLFASYVRTRNPAA